ncbi:MAG: hypothetical protein U0235_17720 [Polyangiaceae bacterium]
MNRIARTFALLATLALGGIAPTLVAPPAAASVSVAVQFEELVQRSKAVAVVVPMDQRSVWEGRYIMTYTKVRVEDGIAGAETGKEVWIVSRGGTVGNIGQAVDGEPTFTVGHPTLAFLREDVMDDKAVFASGVFIVTARAQGQFPIVEDDTKERKKRIVSHAGVGLLLPPVARIPAVVKPLAREVLEGKTLDEARATISDTWRKLHVEKR